MLYLASEGKKKKKREEFVMMWGWCCALPCLLCTQEYPYWFTDESWNLCSQQQHFSGTSLYLLSFPFFPLLFLGREPSKITGYVFISHILVPSVTAPVLEGGYGVRAQYKTITVIIILKYYSLQIFLPFGASGASTKLFIFLTPLPFIFLTTL